MVKGPDFKDGSIEAGVAGCQDRQRRTSAGLSASQSGFSRMVRLTNAFTSAPPTGVPTTNSTLMQEIKLPASYDLSLEKLGAGKPVEALHLTVFVLAYDQNSRMQLNARIRALEYLQQHCDICRTGLARIRDHESKGVVGIKIDRTKDQAMKTRLVLWCNYCRSRASAG
jgi:hypothetical protein